MRDDGLRVGRHTGARESERASESEAAVDEEEEEEDDDDGDGDIARTTSNGPQ